MRAHRPAAATLLAAVLVMSVAGCSGDGDGSPNGDQTTTSPAPTSTEATPQPTSASATPVPTASAPSHEPTDGSADRPATSEDGSVRGTVPGAWEDASEDAVAGLEEDPQVESVLGAWREDDAEISVVTVANTDGWTDPEAYFESVYGSVGQGDGIEVSHETSTTAAGDAVLFVDMAPAAGQGGDAQTMFVIFTSATLASGALTYDGPLDAAQRARLVDLAHSMEVD